MSMGGAAGQFRDEFRELYQAAGEPTLASLVRLSRQQHPPAQISDTTLSDWLAGKSVPGRQSSRVFLALVAVLQARAKSGQAYMPRSDWWWQQLLTHAQDERSAAQKSGRPPRPDVPERTPARSEKETPQPALRSVYLEQVRRIAPLVLSGREGELAALAEFCLEPSRGSYVWWQAGPWAGKSALLSSFVLSPPSEVSERVRFVAFFITARLASQDTRHAFIDFVLEQLAALTGEALPAVLPEATREAYLLALLEQGARSLKETGKRLVLVVDGLDEDRSVTTGPDAHSIAGLLPASPPAGMRVIVASRPNPPVPGDVPDWHPLRDPAVVRPLPSSRYARDVRRLGSQELKRLLRGSAPEQDLLGLITAARGGLSARDLASLAKIPLWEAEEILHTTAGRTFARRPEPVKPDETSGGLVLL